MMDEAVTSVRHNPTTDFQLEVDKKPFKIRKSELEGHSRNQYKRAALRHVLALNVCLKISPQSIQWKFNSMVRPELPNSIKQRLKLRATKIMNHNWQSYR